jgi:hypothetical protein
MMRDETAIAQERSGAPRAGIGGFCALAIYAAAAIVVTFPLALHLSDSLAQKYVDAGLPFGDVNFYLWFFWWIKKALFEIHSSLLFTSYQAFPHGVDLTFTTLSIFNGFLSLVLQPFFSSVCIYNLFFLASLALAGFFTFLLVREIGGEPWGALLGGFIFSYSPFFFFHYAHLNLLSIYWIPLTLFLVARMISRRSFLYALLASLGFAATALCDWYNLVYLVLLLLFWLGSALWRLEGEAEDQLGRYARRIAILAVAASIIASSFAVAAIYCIPLILFLFSLFVLYGQRGTPEANIHARTVALFILLSVLFLAPYGYPVLTRYFRAADIVQVPLESKIYFSAEPLSLLLPPFAWEWLWHARLPRAIQYFHASFSIFRVSFVWR